MKKIEKLTPMYGLPREVKFCAKCLMSNQRPNSAVEFNHNINTKKETISFFGFIDFRTNAFLE